MLLLAMRGGMALPRRKGPPLSLLEPATGDDPLADVRTSAAGPAGSLPLTDAMLRDWSSGDLFGLSQNAGMGWSPEP